MRNQIDVLVAILLTMLLVTLLLLPAPVRAQEQQTEQLLPSKVLFWEEVTIGSLSAFAGGCGLLFVIEESYRLICSGYECFGLLPIFLGAFFVGESASATVGVAWSASRHHIKGNLVVSFGTSLLVQLFVFNALIWSQPEILLWSLPLAAGFGAAVGYHLPSWLESGLKKIKSPSDHAGRSLGYLPRLNLWPIANGSQESSSNKRESIRTLYPTGELLK